MQVTMKIKLLLSIFFYLLAYKNIFSQITITQNNSATALAQSIAGPGIVVTNATINCATSGLGLFSNGSSGAGNVGISNGVLLTTGNVTDAAGAASGTVSIDNTIYTGTPGADPDLLTIAGFASINTCKLEFDLTPVCANLSINYVFASEEYPNYVCSNFNDAFGFFISGPGIVGTQNIAIIPSTTIGVAINSINNGIPGIFGTAGGCTSTSYTGLYVDNTNGTQIEYNGFTIPLTASATVTPCQTYHLKIVIADAGDALYDSGVFIQQDGITCTPAVPVLTVVATPTNICAGQSSTLTASGSTNNTYTWTPSGSLNFNSGSIVIATPAVSTIYTVSTTNICNSVISETIAISVNTASTPSITSSGPYCQGSAAVNLTSSVLGGVWSGVGITDPNLGTFNPTMAGVGNHLISYSTSGACGGTATVNIVVNPSITPTITPSGPFCNSNTNINLVANPTGGVWSGTGINNSSLGTFNPSLAGNGNHIITYSISGVCNNPSSSTITVNSSVLPTINAVGPFCLLSNTINLSANPSGGTWSGVGITNSNSGTFSPSSAGLGSHIVTYSLSGLCGGSATTTVQVNSVVTPTITNTGPFCVTYGTVNLSANPTGGIWSGVGITNSITGTFDPAVSNIGTHVITYSVSSSCAVSSTTSIQVNSIVTPTIVNSGPYCLNDGIVNLVASPSGGVWSGAGITSSISGSFDPTIANVGTHVISYSTSGNCGSVSTESIIVTNVINPSIVQSGPYCVSSSTMNLTSNVNGGIWSGTGIEDANLGVFNPFVAGAGTHLITYTLPGACGGLSTTTLIVKPLPTATFTPVNACVNANVLLNNASSIPLPDNITTYAWNFGTGALPATSSSVQNPPTLTYSSGGVKTITLTVTANTTCSASITQTVEVYAQPVANFSATAVCQGTATAYTDLSIPTGSITGWSWSYTNNGISNSTLNAPTHIFPTSGTFTTSLIVTDNRGCKDTVALPIDVWGHTIPNFTPDKVCFGTSSVFTNLTDETSNPNVGAGTTYVWDFADGSATSNVLNPSHTYTLGGNANASYNVTLTATSLHNCIDNIVKPVSVFAVPTASFTSDSVCLGSATQLTDASLGNGNVINTYIWDFLSDGTIDTTGLPNPNFVFPSIGINLVTYTVLSSPVIGLVCSNVTNSISVWVNPNPVPDFTFVNNCINSQPNIFSASSSSIAVGTNTAYVWAYGDGSVSAPTLASTSTVSYAAPGVYNVTLTVTSNKGCAKNIVKQVEVYAKPIMKIANSLACDAVAMTFSAQAQAGSGTATNWYWDFNNSIFSIEATGQNTNFTFTGPGAQTVGLVTETANGCRDTVIKSIYVNYVPVPQFSVDIPSGCPTHCVNFNDLTPAITGPAQIIQWQWSLGDGSTASGTSVAHCYNNTSSNQLALFNVGLTVTTDSGCVGTITKPNFITVYPKPIASYTVSPNPASITEPLAYFINQSQDYTKWWWTFVGTGPFKIDSVNVNPTHFYDSETAQTYYTNLIVMNQYGCTDIAFVPVEIKPEFTFYIPNAFSPSNGDGINDYFNGTGMGIDTYEMWVFDRWGERIFYTNDIKKGWDGKVQGKGGEPKQDVYVWKVRLKDVLGKKHEYVGHVTLLK